MPNSIEQNSLRRETNRTTNDESINRMNERRTNNERTMNLRRRRVRVFVFVRWLVGWLVGWLAVGWLDGWWFVRSVVGSRCRLAEWVWPLALRGRLAVCADAVVRSCGWVVVRLGGDRTWYTDVDEPAKS